MLKPLSQILFKTTFKGPKLLNLTKGGIKEALAAERLGGKIFRGALGFTAYAGAGEAGAFMLSKVREREQAVYGNTAGAEYLGDAESLIRTAGYIEGGLSVFGLSHISRLRKLPGDIKNYASSVRKGYRRATGQRYSNFRTPGRTRGFGARKPPKKKRRPSLAASSLRLGLTSAESSFFLGIPVANKIMEKSGLSSTTFGNYAAAFIIGTPVAAALPAVSAGIKFLSNVTQAESAILGTTAVLGGAYAGMNIPMYNTAEGNITDVSRENAMDRLNYSTAGLTFALRTNRKVQ